MYKFPQAKGQPDAVLKKREMFEDYRCVKVLGAGSFGKAYLVERKSDQLKLVMKTNQIQNLSKAERQDIINEAKVMEHV
jgi:serine/threonine protein kinase